MARANLFSLRLIIVLFLLVALMLLIFFFSQDELTRLLGGWRVNIDLVGFKIVSSTSDKTSFSKRQAIEARKKDTVARLNRTITYDHQKLIDDRKFIIDSLFLPTTSPYPEMITNVVECPEELKPKVEQVENGTIYSLFAGERLNYGVCSQDLVKYFSTYGIFDCQQKGIFEVSVFSKQPNEPQIIVHSFKC